MIVTGVLEEKQPISYQHNDHLLKVSFDKNLPAGTEKEIEVIYSGIPKDGLVLVIINISAVVFSLIIGPTVPVIGFPVWIIPPIKQRWIFSLPPQNISRW
jgi:hypothetical protein